MGFFPHHVTTPPVFLLCMGAADSQTQAGEMQGRGKGAGLVKTNTKVKLKHNKLSDRFRKLFVFHRHVLYVGMTTLDD